MLMLWIVLAIILFGLFAIAVFGAMFARALDAADQRDLAAHDYSGTAHAPPVAPGVARAGGATVHTRDRAAKARQVRA